MESCNLLRIYIYIYIPQLQTCMLHMVHDYVVDCAISGVAEGTDRFLHLERLSGHGVWR